MALKPAALEKRQALCGLFPDYPWNYLPQAILEGSHGDVLVDNPEDAKVAFLVLPRLQLMILGGDAEQPGMVRLLKELPHPTALMFAAPGWQELVEETLEGRLIRITRYAFTSEKLERGHLQSLRDTLPEGFRLAQMNLALAKQLKQEQGEFSEDHLVNFDSAEDFLRRGFGFCILQGEQIVCAATTFAVCSKGIEIQINTREQQRRKGLASAAAAALILHSLERGLDPNWDAASPISARLAEKLGYIPQGEYPLLLYTGSPATSALVQLGLKIKSLIQRKKG